MDDYFNNDESDDFFNNDEDSSWEKILRQLQGGDEDVEDLLEKQRIDAINENYNHIKQCGIDVIAMKAHGEENFNKLKYTINVMLEHFEEFEEFEKCAELKSIKDELEKIDF